MKILSNELYILEPNFIATLLCVLLESIVKFNQVDIQLANNS